MDITSACIEQNHSYCGVAYSAFAFLRHRDHVKTTMSLCYSILLKKQRPPLSHTHGNACLCVKNVYRVDMNARLFQRPNTKKGPVGAQNPFEQGPFVLSGSPHKKNHTTPTLYYVFRGARKQTLYYLRFGLLLDGPESEQKKVRVKRRWKPINKKTRQSKQLTIALPRQAVNYEPKMPNTVIKKTRLHTSQCWLNIG